MPRAIGMIEVSSIAAGYQAEDEMVKAASVEVIIARTICSGKFCVIIGGDVAAVKASLEAGEKAVAGFLIDQVVIPNVDDQVFPALSSAVDLPLGFHNALGIVETFSIAAIIRAADAAAKAANVTLFRVHLAMAVGGKGFLLLCGDVAAVRAAVEAAVAEASSEGLLVHQVVIPAASPELFRDFI